MTDPATPNVADEPEAPVVLTPEQVKKRQRGNIVIALSLLAFMALVFAVTLARLGANVLDRPI